MDEELNRALRDWRAQPEQPGLAERVVALARRAGQPLPPELDLVRWVEDELVELLNEQYQVHDAAGYVHQLSLSVLPHTQIEVGEELREALSPEPYSCLALRAIEPREGIDLGAFYSIGYGAGGEPPAHRSARETLARLTEDFARRLEWFPLAQCYSVTDADYPNDGEVYWWRGDVVALPELGQSLVFALQYFW